MQRPGPPVFIAKAEHRFRWEHAIHIQSQRFLQIGFHQTEHLVGLMYFDGTFFQFVKVPQGSHAIHMHTGDRGGAKIDRYGIRLSMIEADLNSCFICHNVPCFAKAFNCCFSRNYFQYKRSPGRGSGKTGINKQIISPKAPGIASKWIGCKLCIGLRRVIK